MQIAHYGHPVLRVKCARIDDLTTEIKTLAHEMIGTMIRANGCGLAAPQVGHAVQLAIVDITGLPHESSMTINGRSVEIDSFMPMVLINPELTLNPNQLDIGGEGCLSFSGLGAPVIRSTEISVKAQTLDRDTIEFQATGFLARVIQHEVDHLNGVLFVDRVPKRSVPPQVVAAIREFDPNWGQV